MAAEGFIVAVAGGEIFDDKHRAVDNNDSMQTEKVLKSEAVAELQKLVSSWLAGGLNRTRTSFARASTVSESAIRRLMNDNVYPSGENLLKIVSFLKNAKTTSELFSDKNDSITQLIGFHFPDLKIQESQESLLWSSFSDRLDTPTKKQMFFKISNMKSVAAEEILSDFGRFGLLEANSLVEAGILNFSEGNFSIKNGFDQIYVADSKTTAELIATSLALYYKPNMSVNASCYTTQMVSKKGYGKVMDSFDTFQREIHAIAEQHPGEVPLFVGTLMDTMTTKSCFGEGVENE